MTISRRRSAAKCSVGACPRRGWRRLPFAQRKRRDATSTTWYSAGLLTVSVLALIVTVSCTREAVHRVLVFLYDGVPPLEAAAIDLEAEGPEMLPESGETAPPSRAPARTKFYSHPAYLQSRCPGCHVGEGGGLLQTVREGLCRSCHPENPPKKEFVHGPVAVNDCLACHRYHKSPFPKVLVTDAQTLCFQCHEKGELRTDEHHATIEEERCIDCHDAHGGDDRFFLIRKTDTVDSS